MLLLLLPFFAFGVLHAILSCFLFSFSVSCRCGFHRCGSLFYLLFPFLLLLAFLRVLLIGVRRLMLHFSVFPCWFFFPSFSPCSHGECGLCFGRLRPDPPISSGECCIVTKIGTIRTQMCITVSSGEGGSSASLGHRHLPLLAHPGTIG